ncbi:hypothetical protein EYR41_010090 [Orbilia oligospora]|uniref:Flo11 domain-containing protein n=1 Tax=Orbilia oligospora TaxID=2813651 RepID=A0A8H2HNK8_ORBOL|nr:hypothetical protein EYR41_010090 [Orbilia oligospora]
MISKHLALLALIAPLVSAQCSGYNYIPSFPHCGINFSDDTYLESNLIPLDSGCPQAFGNNYQAKATYTDYEGVVSTVGLVKPVTSPSNPTETVRFLYNIRYSDILEDSPVTVNYYFPRNTLTISVPAFTIYNTAVYTDATSTTLSTVESGTTTSTSTIHSTSTTTTTKLSTITSVGVTETITLKPITKTRTITHAVKPTTKKVFTTKKITTTLPCIPNPKHPRRQLHDTPNPNLDLNRRDTVFESKTYVVPTCANTRPTTTTLYTNTVVSISTITTKLTKTLYTTKIDKTVTSTSTLTIWNSATGRVTVTPPPVTITKNVNAPRVTVTTSVTIKLTVTKYATKTCCNKPPPPRYTTNKSCVIKPPKTTTKKVVKTTTRKMPVVYKTTTRKVVKTTPKAPGYKPKTTAKPKPKTTKKCTKSAVKTTKRY